MPRVPELVFRNAATIRKYLELWPLFVEQSLMGSEDPYDRKARGSSRPPTPEEKGLAMMGEGLLVEWQDPKPFVGEEPKREPADGRAQKALRDAIGELRRSDAVRVGGVPFSRVLSSLWGDPGSVPRWLAGGTKTDRSMREALRGHSLLLAWSLEAVCPGAKVRLDPRGQELAEQSAGTRAAGRGAQKASTATADYEIVRRLEEIQAELGCTRGNAVLTLSARSERTANPLGADRIRMAVVRENRRKSDASGSPEGDSDLAC